jgi:hypothetical protein
MANVPNQRRQTTLSTPQVAFARPLHWGCYAAINTTTSIDASNCPIFDQQACHFTEISMITG